MPRPSRPRSPGALALLLGLGACGCVPAAPPRPAGAAREEVASPWELAPRDASGGVVAREGTFARLLALVASLQQGPARAELDKATEKREMPPLATAEQWAEAGLDPGGAGAAFTWPDRARGLLLVLPVRDRALFRKALHATVHLDGAREIDDLPGGYQCTPAVGRYLCAKALSDLDAAAGRHGSALAAAVERLSPDDRGDLDAYADTRAPEVARLAERAVKLGKVTAIAATLRLRDGGASGRAHVLGELHTPLARSLAGAPPPPGLSPSAAGAPSVVRIHLELPGAIDPEARIDPLVRAELVDQLTGDVEMSTSGHGLAGFWAAAPLKDAARAEAAVKKMCEDTGGSKRRYALDRITVTAHGCSAVVDPTMLLLPVAMTPLPVAVTVADGRLVVTAGDGAAPGAAQRSLAAVAKDSAATWALGDAEALVAFTRSPWIGPDTGAGAAFKALFSLLPEKSVTQLDALDDLGTHVAQALLAARMAEDGLVITGDVVTFAADPPPALAAYQAALALRLAGDVAGYRARLAAIEAAFPGTLAAERAAEVRAGSPFLGAGAVLLGAFGNAARKNQ